MKRAFTLIELIISIIIIGIASAALPLMLSSANKLEEQTINQDVFYKSTNIMMQVVSSAYWDKKCISLAKEGVPPSVLDVPAGEGVDPKLNRVSNTSNLRIGGFDRGVDDHRQFYSYTLWLEGKDTNASYPIPNTPKDLKKAFADTTDVSIDDWNAVYLVETAAEGANVRYDVSVAYVDDTTTVDATNSKKEKATWRLNGPAATNATNLKRIYIKASRNIGSDTMEVGFTYFSSNIGTPEIKTK